MASRGRGFFSHYIYISSTKIVQVVMICPKNMAARGRVLFSLYIYIENLKKSSCQKPLDRFQYNLAEIFPWWLFTKIGLSKNMALGGGAYFPFIST